jgi:hypothetical protein
MTGRFPRMAGWGKIEIWRKEKGKHG